MKIVMDMDPGVDDAIALILALNSPELEILGITTTYGNVSVEKSTKNVFRILKLVGKTDIPVFTGARKPLLGTPDYAEDIHGEEGLGDVSLSHPKIDPAGNAFDFLREVVRSESDITIVATGPLTNLALTILIDEQFVSHVDKIIHMGGAYNLTKYGYGNVGPLSEFNIYSDPYAASIVFNSGAEIFSVGLDVTRHPDAVFTAQEIREIGDRGGRIGKLLPGMVERMLNSEGYVAIHDAVPVAYLVDSSILKFMDAWVSVETSGLEAYGATILDNREWVPMELRQGAPIKVAYWIHGSKYKNLLWDRVFK